MVFVMRPEIKKEKVLLRNSYYLVKYYFFIFNVKKVKPSFEGFYLFSFCLSFKTGTFGRQFYSISC